jgi:hypothetical protein
VGVRLLAIALAALVAAGPVQQAPVQVSAAFLQATQQPDGGFAEAGGASDPTLTAWVVLALEAAGRNAAALRAGGLSPADYLAAKPARTTSELALRVLALDALGQNVSQQVEQLERQRVREGRIGPLVNSTIWSAIALRAAGRPVPRQTLRYLIRRQHRSGGWSWSAGGAPDSNDTAAAIQALRAGGVRGVPIVRGLAYLRRLQNGDGGFALIRGRSSDAQSTAWAIQAFVAAGRKPPAGAERYLASLRQPQGSYRYTVRRTMSPVWVTASVLPALVRKPFPLRQ